MARGPSRASTRIAQALALLSCVALLAADMHLGTPGELGWWFGVVFFLAWEIGPILLAAFCVSLSPTFRSQLIFLLLEAAFMTDTARACYAVIAFPYSLASLDLIFGPLWLYIAWLAVVVAAVCFGWRARGWKETGSTPL
jgi:hypothetical protein